MGIFGVALTLLAEVSALPLSMLFVGYDAELFEMTTYAFRLYATSFLMMGFNIFGSAFFIALNNGVISVAISFIRTLLFQAATVLALPVLLGIDGIWLAVTVAELLALIITIFCFALKKKQYHYV